MLSFKNRTLLVVLIFSICIILLIISSIFSKKCEFAFQEECINSNNYWEKFEIKEPIKLFEGSSSQIITFSHKDLKLSINLMDSLYPPHNQSLQYKQLNKQEVEKVETKYKFNLVSIEDTILVCYENKTHYCNFYESSEENTDTYNEKIWPILNNKYSLAILQKGSNITEVDIQSVKELLEQLMN